MTGETGQIIGSIIVVLLLILANVKDFVRLYNGATNQYIQANSGMLYTLVGLFWFVMESNNWKLQIILLYGAYITIYTLFFF
ncbi:MAG: hypothetical protein IJ661_09360 [Lachnospiraceae bacterium]|nr:hypothetical protein [Lachnospiraceae bacterium]